MPGTMTPTGRRRRFPMAAACRRRFRADRRPDGQLGAVPITIGSLTVNKAVTGDFDTTISGTATNTLTFDGGFTILNGFSSVGTGLTIVAAPVVFNSTLTVTQGDNDILDFTQSLSGTGGLAVNRNAGTYSTVVALSAENTYSGGTTTITGSTADDSLVVRLGHANAIPASTNVTLTQSAILELAAGDFTRAIGTAAGRNSVHRQRQKWLGRVWGRSRGEPWRRVGHGDLGHRRGPGQFWPVGLR